MSAALMNPDEAAIFGPWLGRWGLAVDGAAITGPNSRLLPVRRGDERLMLKAAMQPREVRAAGYLVWLGGVGAPTVLAMEDDAMLMERVIGPRSVLAMEDDGDERDALGVLCEVAAALHAPRPQPPPDTLDLATWFGRLIELGPSRGGLFGRAAALAAPLLAHQRDVRPLHGDLHHWNVLDGGGRGWLAIDPNALIGERTLEFALMVLPTDLVRDTDPETLRRRAHIVADLADVEPRRLLTWLMAQSALWDLWSAPGREWLAVSEAVEAAMG
jgi:streptomycin 6-kinase